MISRVGQGSEWGLTGREGRMNLGGMIFRMDSNLKFGKTLPPIDS